MFSQVYCVNLEILMIFSSSIIPITCIQRFLIEALLKNRHPNYPNYAQFFSSYELYIMCDMKLKIGTITLPFVLVTRITLSWHKLHWSHASGERYDDYHEVKYIHKIKANYYFVPLANIIPLPHFTYSESLFCYD